MIGIGWSLLQPIATTIVLCVVFSKLYHQNMHTLAPLTAKRADVLGLHYCRGRAWLPMLL